jgi:8-oxo-dGTP pyrophosphatase MutT (NUDIX family)
MTPEQKQVSDEKCLELFGKTNEQMHNEATAAHAAPVDRSALPLRRAAHVFLLDDSNNLVAKLKPSLKGSYLALPGGGIDEGETPEQAAVREVMEETGHEIHQPRVVGSVKWTWPEDWAQTEKQKIRYTRYRGAHDHFVVAKVKRFNPLGGSESQESYPMDQALKLIEDSNATLSGEGRKLRRAQIKAFKSIMPPVTPLSDGVQKVAGMGMMPDEPAGMGRVPCELIDIELMKELEDFEKQAGPIDWATEPWNKEIDAPSYSSGMGILSKDYGGSANLSRALREAQEYRKQNPGMSYLQRIPDVAELTKPVTIRQSNNVPKVRPWTGDTIFSDIASEMNMIPSTMHHEYTHLLQGKPNPLFTSKNNVLSGVYDRGGESAYGARDILTKPDLEAYLSEMAAEARKSGVILNNAGAAEKWLRSKPSAVGNFLGNTPASKEDEDSAIKEMSRIMPGLVNNDTPAPAGMGMGTGMESLTPFSEAATKLAALEKTSAPIDDLLRIKKAGDVRDYATKSAITMKMVLSNPNDFIIDSDKGHVIGLTHVPTGFRIHAPKNQFGHFYKPQDIDFPAEEHASVSQRLADVGTVSTTRIMKERGRYRKNELLRTPWGASVQVTDVADHPDGDISVHPYFDQLTVPQRQQINGNPFEVIHLKRVDEPATETEKVAGAEVMEFHCRQPAGVSFNRPKVDPQKVASKVEPDNGRVGWLAATLTPTAWPTCAAFMECNACDPRQCRTGLCAGGTGRRRQAGRRECRSGIS